MAVDTNYDSEFCGNLAIHQTNSIQDYGYLMVIDCADFKVLQASENVMAITGKTVQEFIGTKLADLMNDQDLGTFNAEIAKGDRERVPFNLHIITARGLEPCYFLAHIRASHIILEVELSDNRSERTFANVFQEVRSFIATIENQPDLEQICRASIGEIRRIAGFDGIRMYRFDEEWNGTVIAEEISGQLESYLGQTFPASDVPKQARALYLKNPFRLIPNRNYTSYRLYPVINTATNSFTDLSDCNLRSIAGVHLEYMANMNVMASMSIRILVDGQLWGLISCHHITKKYLSTEKRAIFEWLSMEISYRISAVIAQQKLNHESFLLQKKAQVIEGILTRGGIVEGLTGDPENLFSLFNATGCAICLNARIFTLGTVPAKEELENLMMWVEGRSMGRVFSSAALSEEHEESRDYIDRASGILVIPIRGNNRDFVICFRPEAVIDIKWGGDPKEAISFENDGINYHPRNSFKLWLQTVHGQSQRFTTAELDIAESLRSFFFEFSSTELLN